jgi:hypothetical protein
MVDRTLHRFVHDTRFGEKSLFPGYALGPPGRLWLAKLVSLRYNDKPIKSVWRNSVMSVEERIAALKAKHQALEAAIQEENNRPHPDELHIATLKKQKLRIKDEIAGISVSA